MEDTPRRLQVFQARRQTEAKEVLVMETKNVNESFLTVLKRKEQARDILSQVRQKAGRLGGLSTSRDRAFMATIGRLGGLSKARSSTRKGL